MKRIHKKYQCRAKTIDQGNAMYVYSYEIYRGGYEWVNIGKKVKEDREARFPEPAVVNEFYDSRELTKYMKDWGWDD